MAGFSVSSARFVAEKRAGPELFEELSALDPANPFATLAYARAEEALGGEPWILGCRDGERLICGCAGFQRRGRINRELTIPSLPEMPPAFWSGLRSFIAGERITLLVLDTYASRAANIPSLGTQLSRSRRYEFVVPLDRSADDLLMRMQAQHRQRVRQGMKAGLTVRVGSECRVEEHVSLMQASLDRRENRGEPIETRPVLKTLLAFVESGCCRIFQASMDHEVVSSMSVAVAPGGRYLHTSGTSPTGMKAGASHFLLYEIMRTSMAEGACLFNLGGAFDPDSGLARYKRHFGAQCWESEAAQFYVGTWRQRLVWNAARLVKGIAKRNGTAPDGTEG